MSAQKKTTSGNDAVSKYLSGIGRKGGESTSADKAAAARENGKRGGRPAGSKDSRPRRVEAVVEVTADEHKRKLWREQKRRQRAAKAARA